VPTQIRGGATEISADTGSAHAPSDICARNRGQPGGVPRAGIPVWCGATGIGNARYLHRLFRVLSSGSLGRHGASAMTGQVQCQHGVRLLAHINGWLKRSNTPTFLFDALRLRAPQDIDKGFGAVIRGQLCTRRKPFDGNIRMKKRPAIRAVTATATNMYF
jgi:hypothetical protein